MAVLSDYQGKGFGTIILKEICTFVETKKRMFYGSMPEKMRFLFIKI